MENEIENRIRFNKAKCWIFNKQTFGKLLKYVFQRVREVKLMMSLELEEGEKKDLKEKRKQKMRERRRRRKEYGGERKKIQRKTTLMAESEENYKAS